MARIDQLLRSLHERGGSDLHLAAGHAPRIRIAGALQTLVERGVLDHDALLEMMREIATSTQWSDYESALDVDFAYELAGVARFRVNYFSQERGASAVLRIIAHEAPNLADLGAPEELERFAQLDSGLMLVVGPSGSGKSSTLAAIIELINGSFDKHIVTIEDPIEFVHHPKRCLISQREVGSHTSSFAAGLRGAIQQDPDVIMVDELRDPHAISLALKAAESGLLVFGSVRATAAARALERLLYAFPHEQRQQARVSLARSLAGVIAQRFVEGDERGGRRAAFDLFDEDALDRVLE